MAKIKLLVPLWNHKKGDIIEASKNRIEWAIEKGYAVSDKKQVEKVDKVVKKTKIDQKAENKETKEFVGTHSFK